MARRFTASTSDRIYIGAAGLAGLNFTFGTFACVIQFVTLPAFGTILATNEESGASFTIYAAGTTSRIYDGTSERDGPTLTTGVQYLYAFTKATGTATGRFHIYRFNTNTWTHQAASGTSVNSAANTSVAIGAYADATSDNLDAELWAIALWQGVVMTDSETEELSRGRWLETSPTFFEQWTDGREVGDMPRTLGRQPARQTARTGTTRGVQPQPAGFRFGPVHRRR